MKDTEIQKLIFLELKEFDYGWNKEELLSENGIIYVRDNILKRVNDAKEIVNDLIINNDYNILLLDILSWIYLKERNLFLFDEAKETLNTLRDAYNKFAKKDSYDISHIIELLDEYEFINDKNSYLLFVLGEYHDYELGHEIIVFNPKTNKLAEVVDVDDIKVSLSLFDCSEKVEVSYLFSYNIQKFGRQDERFYEQKAREIFNILNK